MTYGEAAEALLVYPVIYGYSRIDAGLVSDLVKMVKDLEKDNERYLNHISMLQEKIRNGYKWISVEDSPKEDGRYLIYSKAGNMIPSFYNKKENWWGFNDVTHWMPLPEPPKPKEPTFKDVFLAKFPKAVVFEHSGDPRVCAKEVFPQLGDCKSPCDMRCKECWSQPYFEEEGGEE